MRSLLGSGGLIRELKKISLSFVETMTLSLSSMISLDLF
jgi:hypothetical protein